MTDSTAPPASDELTAVDALEAELNLLIAVAGLDGRALEDNGLDFELYDRQTRAAANLAAAIASLKSAPVALEPLPVQTGTVVNVAGGLREEDRTRLAGHVYQRVLEGIEQAIANPTMVGRFGAPEAAELARKAVLEGLEELGQ